MRQPCKMVDSERSAGLWMTRKKDQAILNKNLQLLDKNEKTVVNRITVGQKVVNKRFQWKLYQTKLAHARLISDRELERAVRKTHSMTLNTNVGNDDEEEEGNMLKKIWTQGQKWIDGVRKGRIRDTAPLTFDGSRVASSRLSRTKSAGPRLGRAGTPTAEVETTQRPLTAASLARPTPPVRAATADGILPKVRVDNKSGKGQYIRTSGQGYATEYTPPDTTISPPSGESDLSDVEEDHDAERQKVKLRSKSAKPGVLLNVIMKDNERTPRSKSAATKMKPADNAEKNRPSIFQEEERPPTLLEIQRERVKSANYERKVSQFCDVIRPYRTDRGIPDYYMVRLVEGSEYAKGTKRVPASAYGSECDLSRDLRSMRVRSMTFKTINDYGITTGLLNGHRSGTTPAATALTTCE